MGKTQLWSKMAADRPSATNMSPPTWAIFLAAVQCQPLLLYLTPFLRANFSAQAC